MALGGHKKPRNFYEPVIVIIHFFCLSVEVESTGHYISLKKF